MSAQQFLDLAGPSQATRNRLAAKKQAMPDGSFPMGNTTYLKKAIKATGRAPAAKRPALRRLIRKRARALHATGAKGVAGTKPMTMSITAGRGLELSTATAPRVVRVLVDPRDVLVHPSGNITHSRTGTLLGTMRRDGGLFQAVCADGHETAPGRTAAVAAARLAAYHNTQAQSRPEPATPGSGTATGQATPLNLSVPAVSSGDGPRMTSLGSVGKRAYSKLCAKGVPRKRAAAMAAKAESMVMRGKTP